jgi:hypothetical protein
MLTLNKLVSDNEYGGQVKRELFKAMLANKRGVVDNKVNTVEILKPIAMNHRHSFDKIL